MKKLVFGIIAVVMFSFAGNAQEKLEEKLEKNENFILLLKHFENVLERIDSETFLKNFDKEKLINEKESYLAEITGLNIQDLSEMNERSIEYTKKTIEDIPELKKLNEDELLIVIDEATNNYLNQERGRGISAACAGCKSKGLSSMAFNTYVGAIAGGSIGGPFSLWTTWIGGTFGFWYAAEEALDCIRTYCN